MNVNGHWVHHIKTVNGVTTTFKAGDRPVFTAGTPAGSDSVLQCEFWTGSDGSEVNSVEFWDQNITNHIDAFKPGVTYRYGLYLKPARGFYFTPDTKLVINGVECGYQASEASEVDPESGWIYTLWLSTNLTFTPEATPAQPLPQPVSPRPSAASARFWWRRLSSASAKSQSVTLSCPKRLQMLQIEMNRLTANLMSRSVTRSKEFCLLLLQIEMNGRTFAQCLDL